MPPFLRAPRVVAQFASVSIIAALASQGFPLASANAQDADTGTTATSLAPIIVTARKTEEELKDVPQSVTVVSGETLQSNPMDPATAIAHNSPNVEWQNATVGRQFFSIRGVSGLGAPLNYADGTIGFNVNGVPNSMMSASNVLIDVDHIEVLRGPQGTLWGTNALGGAINVVTNQPDGEREIKLTTEVGENGYALGEAVVGGNIIPDAVDGRMAVRFNTFDGDIDSLYTDELGGRKIGAFRGGLKFTGLDDTTITVSGSYLHDESHVPFYLLRTAPGFPVSGLLAEPKQETSHADAAVTVEHEFDAFRFTSISSFQNNEIDGRADNGETFVTPGAVSDPAHTNDVEKVYSQEFRLNSFEDSPVRWVAGANVLYSDLNRSCEAAQCAPAPYLASITGTANLRSLNLGLFGDVSVPLGDHWEVSFGGRVSHDDISMKKGSSSGDPSLEASGSTQETYLTGRTALAYKWSEDAQTYVSIARGHGSRIYPLFGYPTAGVLADPYPSSTGVTYEAGTKVSLFDDRLELDGSVFYNDIKDGIVLYYDPAAFGLAATYQDYTTKGFELQARAKLTDDLSLNAGVGYTRTELGANGANGGVAGNEVPNIPAWTFNLGLAYETPSDVLGFDGSFNFAVDYQYKGKRTADVNDSFDLDAYSLVNARVGWKDAGGDFEVYAFGRNLFDERYETYGTAGFGSAQYVAVGQGRILGLGVTKSF